jgi:hypothetical protein
MILKLDGKQPKLLTSHRQSSTLSDEISKLDGGKGKPKKEKLIRKRQKPS